MLYSRPRLRRAASLFISTLLILLSAPFDPTRQALAFKPTEYWKGTPNDVTHHAITQRAIRELIENENLIPGVNRITPAMQKAIDQIKEGNSNTDLSSDFFVSEAHFTEESFDGSRSRLINNYHNVYASLRGVGRRRKDLEAARTALGTSLHTIQDFYSHSNWVEMGRSSPFEQMGHATLGTGFDPNFLADKNFKTCTDCNKCNNCTNNVNNSKLTTAYYGLYPTSTKPDGKCSHGAKRVVKTVPNPAALFNPWLPKTITITYDPDTTENSPARGGISKDSLDCQDAPHSHLHFQAVNVALESTKKYIVYLTKQAQLKMTPRELRTFFGVDSALAFAVDTTGSMSEQIAGVRQQLTEIVNSRRGTDLEPSRYVLVPFGDPDVGPVTNTEDPDEFIAAIGGLYASGGGDCPELPHTGMLQALNAMEDGGELMMVTDASSKDGGLAGSVNALAQEKDVKITTIATGSCSPVDPEYYRTARATGGQVFVLSPSEVDNITKLADFVARPNAVELASVADTLSGASKTYTVAVDSKTTRVTFSVSGTPQVTLRRPDGTQVLAGQSGVEVVRVTGQFAYVDAGTVRGGAIYSITNPAPGNWNVTATGTGAITLRVSGESLLNFSSFDFVEFGGGPGHEGYKPVSGAPLAGETTTVTAELTDGETSSVGFELRNAAGGLIQTLSLDEVTASDQPGYSGHGMIKSFIGDIVPPSQPFLVYATGTDSAGNPFQRVLPGVVRPSTVKVVGPPLGDLHAGRSTPYAFQVINIGAPGLFQVSAVDDQGYVKGVSPGFVKLGTNEAKSVTVTLEPPAGETAGTADTITLTARRKDNAEVSNSAVVKTQVGAESSLALGTVTATEVSGDGDGVVEAGEEATLSVRLVNGGGTAATGVTAVLAAVTRDVEISSGESVYPDIAPAGTADAATPYRFRAADYLGCGSTVNFMLLARRGGDEGPAMFNFVVPVGSTTSGAGESKTASYTGPPAFLPYSPFGVSVPVQVSGVTGEISDLNFRVGSIDHSFTGTLRLTLTSPQGTTATLVEPSFNGGPNFRNTLLDDESAGQLIDAASYYEAPYTGSYKPSSPLAAFQGEDPNGTWTLTVSDPYYWWYYGGRVDAFSIEMTTSLPVQCGGTQPQTADLSVFTASAPEPVLTGSTVTYTTTISNGGPGAAQGVRAVSDLPAGLTLVSCETSEGGVCGVEGGKYVAVFDSLAAGDSATVVIVASVECATPDAATFAASMAVSSVTPDLNPINNVAVAETHASNPSPVITDAAPDQAELWAPNHRMVDVAINYNVADNCGPLTNVLSVESNEPVDGAGDGHTSPDWEVIDAHHVRLRAERDGGGDGRTYTITITSTDSAGNASQAAVTVRVPKSRGH